MAKILHFAREEGVNWPAQNVEENRLATYDAYIVL